MSSPCVPVLEAGQKHHVFIAHSSHEADYSIELMDFLEARGLTCLLAERDFLPGGFISDNIVSAVYASRRVLLVLSRAFLDSGWCTYEVVIAMEKMNCDNNVIIVPLVVDLSDDDIPQLIRSLTYVRKDTPNYKERLAQALAGTDVKVDDLLPAGNVAHGLAWSYYYGYLSIILPSIGNNIKCSRWWKKMNQSGRHVMSRRLYILIPRSCCCPTSLTEVDRRITHEGNLNDVRRSRAGNMDRVYKNSVWRIRRDNAQDVYFAGEFATVLDTMHKMETGRVAGLNAEHRQYQVNRFSIKLRSILEHGHSRMCHNTFSLIVYDDTCLTDNKPSLSTILTERIPSDIQHDTDHDNILCDTQSLTIK